MTIIDEEQAIKSGFYFALTSEAYKSEKIVSRVDGELKSIPFLEWAERFMSWWRARNRDDDNDVALVRLISGKYVIATKKPMSDDGDNYLSPVAKKVWESKNNA